MIIKAFVYYKFIGKTGEVSYEKEMTFAYPPRVGEHVSANKMETEIEKITHADGAVWITLEPLLLGDDCACEPTDNCCDLDLYQDEMTEMG